jgi:hypothetical protein
VNVGEGRRERWGEGRKGRENEGKERDGRDKDRERKGREGSRPQWRKSGLKSGGTNLWRALEILKYDKNLGDNLY